MNCSTCGKELRDEAKFCNGCGAKMVDQLEETELLKTEHATAQLKKTIPEPQHKKGKSKGKSKRKAMGLTIVLVILILGLVGVTIYVTGGFDVQPIAQESEKETEVEITAVGTDASETKAVGTDATETKAVGTDVMETETQVIIASTMPVAETTVSVMPTAAQPANQSIQPNQNRSQDENIQQIRDVYNRTVENLSSYDHSDGKYYNRAGVLVKVSVENGNANIDAAMRSNGYGAYKIDYYYHDTNGEEPYPIFIFAVIDRKEYRYYFQQGSYIRRIGPDESINDNPEMNSFMETLRDEGVSFQS